jgi:hypothetical protein
MTLKKTLSATLARNAALAGEPSVATLEAHSLDFDPNARRIVARSPRTSLSVLWRLMHDDDLAVAAAARDALRERRSEITAADLKDRTFYAKVGLPENLDGAEAWWRDPGPRPSVVRNFYASATDAVRKVLDTRELPWRWRPDAHGVCFDSTD